MNKCFLLLFLLPYFVLATVHIGVDLSCFCKNAGKEGDQIGGLLKGGILELDYYTESNWYLGQRTQINTGHLCGRNYYGMKTHHFVLERIIEGKMGHSFSFCRLIWTPYSGLSYYCLDDKWNEANTLIQFQTLSIPMGLSLVYPFCINGSFGLILQANTMVYGRWHMAGHPAIPDAQNRLQNRFFYSIETPFSYWVKGVNLKIAPYARFGTLSQGTSCGVSFSDSTLKSFGGRCEIGLAY